MKKHCFGTKARLCEERAFLLGYNKQVKTLQSKIFNLWVIMNLLLICDFVAAGVAVR